MNLTIVGIPITKETITEQYLDFINSDKPMTIISSSVQNGNDYITSKVGHDLLYACGKTITYLDLWSANTRKTPEEVFNNLCDAIEKYDSCYYVVPGSPFYSDMVCDKLIQKYNPKVIDTKSSEQIVKELLGKNTKVLSCLGPNYKYFGIWKLINKLQIFLSLLIYVKIYIIKLGENADIKQIDKNQFKYIMNNKTNDMNYSIFAFTRN